jgi:hypothetical protein
MMQGTGRPMTQDGHEQDEVPSHLAGYVLEESPTWAK